MAKSKKSRCSYGHRHHVVGHIELRSKQDSYYVVCAVCGLVPNDGGLVATWDQTLPAWGLDQLDTLLLHEAFYRLRHASGKSHISATKKGKKK